VEYESDGESLTVRAIDAPGAVEVVVPGRQLRVERSTRQGNVSEIHVRTEPVP
jgi:hypothetical protein